VQRCEAVHTTITVRQPAVGHPTWRSGTTPFSTITTLLHFGMVVAGMVVAGMDVVGMVVAGMHVVGMDCGFAPQMTLEKIVGGAPYGATTFACGNESRQPSERELVVARYQDAASPRSQRDSTVSCVAIGRLSWPRCSGSEP
jgi:hypothetical protein